ncbi:hypothetical protein BMS3Abin07_02004 [bacterium BMS3Abin07]|nr:hypothetical protein BMS3Abin07_02004 [bacterium BMS3Abin07]GBE32449.1 hypothetical protein BMS3Bbin05_01364 [bacterium BMS3Bbin05]HDL20125.1 hypothetical protein [Nitrospirota bacterium]HDO23144.1 hypothetical protein [Nitrospirota bacterium]
MSKYKKGFVLAAIFIFAAISTVSADAVFAGSAPALDVNTVIRQLDPAVNTRARIKKYFRSIKGRKVRGKGKVVNVLGGRSRISVTILTSATKPRKGYNVVIYTKQDAISELYIHDRLSFEGVLFKYSAFGGGSIAIKGVYKKLGQEESRP